MPDHEPWAEDTVCRRESRQELKHHLHGNRSKFVSGLPDGRQLGAHPLCCIDIVEADHADFLGYAPIRVLARLEHADTYAIVVAEDG